MRACCLPRAHPAPAAVRARCIGHAGAHRSAAVFALMLLLHPAPCFSQCPSTCWDMTCDAIIAADSTKTCAMLEETGCDCTGCSCSGSGGGGTAAGSSGGGAAASSGTCPSTCWDMTCDAIIAADSTKTCTMLEGDGCDCGGCACSGGAGGGSSGPTGGGDGTWTQETLVHAGATRTYMLYVPPNGGTAGLMLFFHGVGGSADVRYQYEVGTNADQYGFVGVVPNGGTPAEGNWGWNVDDPSGVNEVAFVHALVQAVLSSQSLSSDLPIIALGFSNGAGMAELLGCHNSHNLWVAHLATHYRADSDYPSTCGAVASPAAEWNAVSDGDFFIASLTPVR